LPEVESARVVIEHLALDRPIVAVDDVDEYVCRPYRTEDFGHALIGRSFEAALRHGKTLRLETASPSMESPALGLHLGMGGRVVVTDDLGRVLSGGDSTQGLAGAHQPKWDRLTVRFADGGAMRLVDMRRLGRAVLDPDLSVLGPDALLVGMAEFRRVLGRSTVAIKARLMDQSVIAGVGNLIADEALWRARIDPARRTVDLTDSEKADLHRSIRSALRYAIQHGGSHAGHMISSRNAEGRCPRCGARMRYARIGGRSTWSCSAEQR
jgi:formamidopyrimidine-DNA glycosylase